MNKAKSRLPEFTQTFHTRLTLDEVREKLQTQPVYYKTELEEQRLVFDHSYFYIPHARFDDAYRTTASYPPPMFNRNRIVLQAQVFLTDIPDHGTRVQLMIGNRLEVATSRFSPFRWAASVIVVICLALIIGGLLSHSALPCYVAVGILFTTTAIALSGESPNSRQSKMLLMNTIMELLEYDSAYEKTLYFEKVAKP